MPQTYGWSHLNRLQIGRYAEYLYKMQLVLQGFDVYSAEVADRGIDFVLRQEPDRYWDVQVKSIRNTGYVYFDKSKFRIRPNLIAALEIFKDGHEPDLYLIPATEWQQLDVTSSGVLVYREYQGCPEYGMNLSAKGIKALDPFRFHAALERIFGKRAAGDT